MNNNRLQLKIIGLFCLLLIVMQTIQRETISGSVEITEDNVINDILGKEAAAFSKRYKSDKTTPLPRIQSLQAYIDTTDMPIILANAIRGRDDGLYETDGPGSIPGPDSYNILISTLSDGKKLYLFYMSDPTIRETNSFLHTKDLRHLNFAVTCAIGVGIFCILGFIVFKPLRSLSEKVKRAKPEDMNLNFPEADRNDEIGLLAQNIQGSYRRISKFVDRERRFTRDVSHELRTPLSVITGAVDLIPALLPENDPKLGNVLARINRATSHMQQTITTFLWLAREENITDTDVFCDVNAAIHATIEDLPPALIQDGVKLNTHPGEHLVIPAPENIFRIVFSNLLTNALTYTNSGSVDIFVGTDHVTVADTGEGIPDEIANDVLKPHVQGKSSKGFGLGLSIATDICARFNWQLSIRRRTIVGTEAAITFPKHTDGPESFDS